MRLFGARKNFFEHMMCRFADVLFLCAAGVLALISWFAKPHQDYAQLVFPSENAEQVPTDFSLEDRHLLSQLELLIAPKSQEREAVRHFVDFGTQLDTLFQGDTILIETDWSHINSMLAKSFPDRDVESLIQILHCYRAYRADLKVVFQLASSESDQTRYNLRIAHFGNVLADTLFATEHRILRQFRAITPQAYMDLPPGDNSACLSSGVDKL